MCGSELMRLSCYRSAGLIVSSLNVPAVSTVDVSWAVALKMSCRVLGDVVFPAGCGFACVRFDYRRVLRLSRNVGWLRRRCVFTTYIGDVVFESTAVAWISVSLLLQQSNDSLSSSLLHEFIKSIVSEPLTFAVKVTNILKNVDFLDLALRLNFQSCAMPSLDLLRTLLDAADVNRNSFAFLVLSENNTLASGSFLS